MKTFIVLFFGLTLSLNAQKQTEATFVKKGNQTEVVTYHDNGIIAQQGQLKNNKPHGEWVSYDQQGRKLTMGTYVDGVKTGKWLFWNKELLLEVDYQNNKPLKTVQWTKSSLASIEE